MIFRSRYPLDIDLSEFDGEDESRWCFGGGKGGSPSPPPAPDPAATAQAQAAANKEAAVAQANINMVNQYTPQGTLEYTKRGNAEDGTPQYSATTTYSPEQQSLYDLTNQASQKYGETANAQLDAVRGTLAQPLDYSSLGAAPVANEATRQSVANSMYERLNPQFDRDRAALDTQLANQGITQGSAAYNTAIDEINRSRNDARLAVDAQAGNEMSRLYGLESAARDRSINEMIQPRQQSLNELSAMLTGSQVQGPQFVNAPQQQVAASDIMGATYGSYNGQMQGYGADLQARTANRQGLYGLLGNAGMAAAIFACFDADEPVEMADGTTKRIVDVQIGDETKGGVVYSKTVADGRNEPWFVYGGVVVTGSHSVKENGVWLRVADSNKAAPTEARPFAHCLGTTGHEIHIAGVCFGDIDEIDRASYIPVWEQALEIRNQRAA